MMWSAKEVRFDQERTFWLNKFTFKATNKQPTACKVYKNAVKKIKESIIEMLHLKYDRNIII